MFRDVHQALIHPDEFFDRGSQTESQALAIVLTLGVVAVVLFPAIVALFRQAEAVGFDVVDTYPPVTYASGGAEVSVPGIFLVAAFGMIAFPLLAWALYGGLFYVLSWPLALEGSIRETLVAVAWGFLPQIIASLVTLIVVIPLALDPPDSLWGLGITLPARTSASMAELSVLPLAGNTVGALCTLWSGYIWTHAIATVRGLSLRRAAVVVGIPVALSLLVTLPVSRVLLAVLS